MVIKPFALKVTPLGSIRRNYNDSSDYTSDEDFDFLEKVLKGEEGKLDSMSLKMLRGILQPPEDERKRDLKPEYLAKKKGKRRNNDDIEDSVDEYGDE